MKKNKKQRNPRDWNAVDAHFRNSGGAMKDRREERGGAKNYSRDLLVDYDMEISEDDMEIDGISGNGDNNHSGCSGNFSVRILG